MKQEWHWVKTVTGILSFEADVLMQMENGFAMIKQTAREIYDYVVPAIFVVWSYTAWAIVTPFARAGTCVPNGLLLFTISGYHQLPSQISTSIVWFLNP